MVSTMGLSIVLSSYLMASATCDTNGEEEYLVTQDFDTLDDNTIRTCIAIATSNAVSSGVAKTVAFSRDMHIVLSGSSININGDTQNITIDGGEHNVIIDGNNTSSIFADSNAAIITLKNLTLQNGDAGIYGGGALSISDAVIENCIFKDNNASYAGAIYVRDDLNITNSTFTNNHATGSGANGSGGAIFINQGVVDLRGVTISENSADDNGSAISAFYSTVALWNSTISGNSAVENGGAIYALDTNTTMYNTTISDNSANAYAVVMNGGTSKTDIENSIIYANRSLYGDDSDTLHSWGHNILSSVGTIIVDGNSGTDKNSADPKLAPLRDNGGDTKTHALMAGSPAIDAGNSIFSVDQRGEHRKGPPDIGAYEYQGFSLAPIYMLLL